ncbi:MAG: NAD(P)-binding protein, partial [Terrimicrobiaceae bacterium]
MLPGARPGHPEAQNAPEPAREAQNGVDSRSGILQTPKELVESPFPLRNQTWKETFCSWTRKPNSYPYWRPSTMAMGSSDTDYLVVGAGAMGMAFTDSLIDHADVHVTLVDRRHTASGHWQDAYPFVQLHQASVFYGVASTVLGSGAVQQSGPEAGLQERARQSQIQAYYDDILHRRFIGSGRVTFLGGSEYHTDGSSHLVTSRVSGETVEIDVRRRIVD